ncbi:hypothetical protein Ptr902_05409 [Pyrenophora tritici-repentis]|nr:hypothetical protein Alg130_08736 [Pyrenophora tritici-repentis]KAI0607043.1 hypothetical protein TUN205_08702 [Pyrenophora tritici-repentis]KAI0619281.1 hypothetical protein TUN199_08736 [Pyrenophora tritici-repentis]KAI2483092.1 hypothetical protein Ptr902_05409 [Pyrenophora tritici-repentis]
MLNVSWPSEAAPRIGCVGIKHAGHRTRPISHDRPYLIDRIAGCMPSQVLPSLRHKLCSCESGGNRPEDAKHIYAASSDV